MQSFSLSTFCLFDSFFFFILYKKIFRNFIYHLEFSYLCYLMPAIKFTVYKLFISLVWALLDFVILCWVLNSWKPFYLWLLCFSHAAVSGSITVKLAKIGSQGTVKKIPFSAHFRFTRHTVCYNSIVRFSPVPCFFFFSFCASFGSFIDLADIWNCLKFSLCYCLISISIAKCKMLGYILLIAFILLSIFSKFTFLLVF